MCYLTEIFPSTHTKESVDRYRYGRDWGESSKSGFHSQIRRCKDKNDPRPDRNRGSKSAGILGFSQSWFFLYIHCLVHDSSTSAPVSVLAQKWFLLAQVAHSVQPRVCPWRFSSTWTAFFEGLDNQVKLSEWGGANLTAKDGFVTAMGFVGCSWERRKTHR